MIATSSSTATGTKNQSVVAVHGSAATSSSSTASGGLLPHEGHYKDTAGLGSISGSIPIVGGVLTVNDCRKDVDVSDERRLSRKSIPKTTTSCRGNSSPTEPDVHESSESSSSASSSSSSSATDTNNEDEEEHDEDHSPVSSKRVSVDRAVSMESALASPAVPHVPESVPPTAHCAATQTDALPTAGTGTTRTPHTGSPASAGTTQTLLVPPHVAVRVIKGEIHNVLTVLRADHRYLSHDRFLREEEETRHVVVDELQHLHEALSVWKDTTRDGTIETTHDLPPSGGLPSCATYLPPFLHAIQAREISAPVTGAALNAIHKFLLYGFLLPLPRTDFTDVSPTAEATRGMTMIAQALLQCTFEETTAADEYKHRRGLSSTHTAGGLAQPRGAGSAANAAAKQRQAAQDEKVVLKLLELAALVVRCGVDFDRQLLSSGHIVGLLDTTLHVSHRASRASPLLQSAASDALAQIVLQVFATTSSSTAAVTDNQGTRQTTARLEIWQQLANLLNPATHDERVTVSSLTAVNIALETCRDDLMPDEIILLQNQVCKYLLLWSTSHDTQILSLTLRVIFNLFQSIRNHLKVPLEVFLTSVHLRLLDTTLDEEREIALESLLEFCQEPALMQDLYLNYDCDVACSNLYESLVTALGKTAQPVGYDGNHKRRVGQTDVIALDASTNSEASRSRFATATTAPAVTHLSISLAAPPLNLLNRLAMDGLLAILDSIVRRCDVVPLSTETQQLRSSSLDRVNGSHGSLHSFRTLSSDDIMSEDELDYSNHLTESMLHDRKKRKHALTRVATMFNQDPMGDKWRTLAVEQGVLDSNISVHGVAELLHTAPGLDKSQLGIFLSKGPDKEYPFHAEVRASFASLYDFADLPFALALRKFLSKFRLPGEAQCIDRFMEAFSKELYHQQGASIFANADAVYVLAFSTIMLNTDLHNPTIKEDKRMTSDQFVRNNRGINGGKDLPAEFLKDLYIQIKENQIQVRREVGDLVSRHEHEDTRAAWESILAKSKEVASPFFTPAGRTRRQASRSGLHDKEMFEVLAIAVLRSFPGIFERSWDDAMVVKALRGLQQTAKLAAHFDMNSVFNEILEFLLAKGRDYVTECITMDCIHMDGDTSVVSNSKTAVSNETMDDDETNVPETEQPIPEGLLCSSSSHSYDDITGAAVHRGLLAFDSGFVMVRKNARRVVGAWPLFVECICALRDAKALPVGLSDLDDFADSSGNVLPLSPFAKKSKRSLESYYRVKADPDVSENRKGWFRAFFKKSSKASDDDSLDDHLSTVPDKFDASLHAKVLMAIAEAADIEKVVQMGSAMLPNAETIIASLLQFVEKYPFDSNPIQEQHAVFGLELAARMLLSNRRQAPSLFMMFLKTFEKVFELVSDTNVPSPFFIERIVVTVLRSSIHLYDFDELRPHLRASLHLLTMTLPRTFVRQIADRMACGLAIILRASYHFFETPNDWAFMGDTLDMLANHSVSRVFVFDGIASTVEHAIPVETERAAKGREERPSLSKEASSALARILTRFVLGFYQRDLTLQVPAMLCLEKLYRHKVDLLLDAAVKKTSAECGSKDSVSEFDPLASVPDKDLWQNIAVAVYSVCRSVDVDVSRNGVECFQRIILRTGIDQIAQEKWVAVLYLIINKQPPTTADVSRGNTFSLLGQLLNMVLPSLSYSKDNRDDLVDLIHATASLAQDNLQQGRRGSVSPLFQKTLQTVTYLSNNMVTEEWTGEPEFSAWASETLLHELEKVGAAGASLKNQEAIKRPAATPPAAAKTTPTVLRSNTGEHAQETETHIKQREKEVETEIEKSVIHASEELAEPIEDETEEHYASDFEEDDTETSEQYL